MNIIQTIFGFIGVITIILLYLCLYAGVVFIICRIIYFFLAMAGVVPPIDIIPLI